MTNKKPSASTPASGPDSTWTTTPTTLRPNRRYITTHDPQTGKSIYAASPPQIYARTPALGGMARSFATDRIPVDFTDEGDVKRYRGGTESAASYRQRHIVVPDGGVNLVVVDLLPGAESGMHRTKSVDFSICVLGEIVHELDSGETRVLLPGDHIVQRGTMHKWINGSKTEPARFVAVTVPAAEFEIPGTGGRMLEEEHLPKAKL